MSKRSKIFVKSWDIFRLMSQVVKPKISFNKLVNMVLNDLNDFREFNQYASIQQIEAIEIMCISQYHDQYQVESLEN